MSRWDDSINKDLKCEMLGYELQISTVTQRVMAGLVNRVMYIWLYKR